jgi:hypothetical protein
VKFNMYYVKRIVSSVLLFLLLVVSTQTIVVLPTAMSQTGTNECAQYEQKQKLIISSANPFTSRISTGR